MFSDTKKLEKRLGKHKVGRFAYLKLLTDEFKTTQSQEAKHQVLANLANFAYDPINNEHMRSLGVLDLFLEQLTENDGTIVQFALGGICNLALDNENKQHINRSGGIQLVSSCLMRDCKETVSYAITTLMFLITAQHKSEITCDANVKQIMLHADHPDKRVQNLATIFLEDYCSGDQVHRLRNSPSLIPLPPSIADSTEPPVHS